MHANHPVPETAARRCHYGYVVLGLIVLVVFSALGLARFGYTSLLPAIQHALHLTNTQTGILQSWNLVGYLVTVGFAGVLAARFGPRAGEHSSLRRAFCAHGVEHPGFDGGVERRSVWPPVGPGGFGFSHPGLWFGAGVGPVSGRRTRGCLAFVRAGVSPGGNDRLILGGGGTLMLRHKLFPLSSGN